MKIILLGLSITSSWGNGHATTYRGLVRELVKNGHDVTFLERDVPWYAENRDLPVPPFGRTLLYQSLDELRDRFSKFVAESDVVIVGSYVPEGIRVGEWVLGQASGIIAFYDIDTPVTLARLERNECDYLQPEQIPRYDLYLSFSGGPVLEILQEKFGSPLARPLYCSVDPDLYYPDETARDIDLGYMGTYSEDRQPALERLLLHSASAWQQGRFNVAGPQYPDTIKWPKNVGRIDHLPPGLHRHFYNRQRFTLNITRSAMIASGHSPSVRLFEAAACGTPVISDVWPGLDQFFEPEREILLARSTEEVLHHLRELAPAEARWIGRRAREKVLAFHTAKHRAGELEEYVAEARRKGRTRHQRTAAGFVAGYPGRTG